MGKRIKEKGKREVSETLPKVDKCAHKKSFPRVPPPFSRITPQRQKKGEYITKKICPTSSNFKSSPANQKIKRISTTGLLRADCKMQHKKVIHKIIILDVCSGGVYPRRKSMPINGIATGRCEDFYKPA